METGKSKQDHFPSYRSELGNRLREVENRFANRAEAAKAAGVAKSTLQNWIEGKSDPSFEGMVRLAKAAGINFAWLASGEGAMFLDDKATPEPSNATFIPASSNDFAPVPVFDVRASAGGGAMNFGEVIADYLSLPVSYLRDQLGVNPKDACGIYVNGDSMQPALEDGGIALLDRSANARANKGDGIYTFRIGDELFIKRLERQGSRIVVHSDNRAYTPWEMTDTDKANMKILARVVGTFRNL